MTLNNLSVKSITSNNGKEFNGLGLLCKSNGIQYYYCDLYHSNQRGFNEVWHTLLRRWYPKGFDFNRITNVELQETTDIINNIKRKIFNYKSSSELKETLLRYLKCCTWNIYLYNKKQLHFEWVISISFNKGYYLFILF